MAKEKDKTAQIESNEFIKFLVYYFLDCEKPEKETLSSLFQADKEKL